MSRQIGTVLGVCILVAVLGSPATAQAAHTVFRRAWWTLAAAGVLGALVAPRMTPRARDNAPAPSSSATADLLPSDQVTCGLVQGSRRSTAITIYGRCTATADAHPSTRANADTAKPPVESSSKGNPS
jgi:predicted MFS family arabinose efflux permease